MSIRFGTDGWRAVIAETFTFANLRLVAQAVADFVNHELKPNGPPEVVIGFDTRFLSDRFAMETARVLAANGIITWLSRTDAPTPAISYNILHKRAAAGIVITASHFSRTDIMPAQSAFWCPTLCASLIPVTRGYASQAASIFCHVASRLPSSTNRIQTGCVHSL